jgi:Tfp pilus assembly protein FimT
MQRNSSLVQQQQRGLTLVEACATLAIASILVGTAVPSFRGGAGNLNTAISGHSAT